MVAGGIGSHSEVEEVIKRCCHLEVAPVSVVHQLVYPFGVACASAKDLPDFFDRQLYDRKFGLRVFIVVDAWRRLGETLHCAPCRFRTGNSCQSQEYHAAVVLTLHGRFVRLSLIVNVFGGDLAVMPSVGAGTPHECMPNLCTIPKRFYL